MYKIQVFKTRGMIKTTKKKNTKHLVVVLFNYINDVY